MHAGDKDPADAAEREREELIDEQVHDNSGFGHRTVAANFFQGAQKMRDEAAGDFNRALKALDAAKRTYIEAEEINDRTRCILTFHLLFSLATLAFTKYRKGRR